MSYFKKKAPPRKSELIPVSDVLEIVKKQLGIDESFFVIFNVWDKEIGIEGAEVAGFKDGVIFVQTPYSAVQYDINLRKKDIIKRLNQYVGSNKIKNIKVEIK